LLGVGARHQGSGGSAGKLFIEVGCAMWRPKKERWPTVDFIPSNVLGPIIALNATTLASTATVMIASPLRMYVPAPA